MNRNSFAGLKAPLTVLCGTVFAHACGYDSSAGNGSRANSSLSEDTLRLGPLAPSSKRSQIGTNLLNPSYYSQTLYFVDQMKQSKTFSSNLKDASGAVLPLVLTPEGWPKSLRAGETATSIVSVGFPPAVDGKKLIVNYQGEGTLEHVGLEVLEKSGTRAVLKIDSAKTYSLRVTSTSAANPIKNITAIYEGGRCANNKKKLCYSDSECGASVKCTSFESNAAAEPFHPMFLEDIGPFKLLRTMDFQQTTGNDMTSWSQYPKRSSASWAPHAPIEVIMDLAKANASDVWVNVPHAADNAFVDNMAKVVKAQLQPSRKVYIEYSNELWNYGPAFTQTRWIDAKGCTHFKDVGTCDVDGDGAPCEVDEINIANHSPGSALHAKAKTASSKCGNYGRRYSAIRAAEVIDRFRNAFPAADRSRVIRVMGGHAANSGLARTQLGEPLPTGGIAASKVDLYAIAPYFGKHVQKDGAAINEESNIGVSDFLAAPIENLFKKVSGAGVEDLPSNLYEMASRSFRGVRDHKSVLASNASFSHVKLIAYEGGQHWIVSPGTPGFENPQSDVITKLFGMNRDARMGAVYAQYLNMWASQTDGQPFVHFLNSNPWSKYGSWGHKEYIGQPRAQAPKYDALLDYIEGK